MMFLVVHLVSACPACESFDTVGSPYSPVSVACMEAMGDSLWQKFKDWIKKIWQKIKNFFIRIADWFREAMGNFNIRFHKCKKWLSDHKNAQLVTKNGKVSDKEVSLPAKSVAEYEKQYKEVCEELRKDLFNNTEWQSCISEINVMIEHSIDSLVHDDDMSKNQVQGGVRGGYYNGSGMPTANSGITGYDPSKKDDKATGKLLEKIEKLKKKIKEKDLFKFKKIKVSEYFKGDAANGARTALDQMNKILIELENVIKSNEQFERVRANFSNTVNKNLDKLNNHVQRTDGGSIGAKSRAKVSNQINHVTKVVFKSGIVPVINNKIIGIGFKAFNAYRECLEGSTLNNE